MFKNSYQLCFIIISALYTGQALAHAEHDKARYVAIDGKDNGTCETPAEPCLSIGYAAKKANKGDKVLVAAGEYHIKNVDELFYLTSDLIPSYGGYSQAEHYKAANSDKYPTYLSGVPATFSEQLRQRGFTVIVDKKSKTLAESAAFQEKLDQFDAIKQSQSNVACTNGLASEFPCNKVDLVAHVPLNQFFGSPSAANDIWGHVDLNSGIEYAIIGLRNGTSVVSLEDPSSPSIVGHIPGLTAIWRDIKVYQYFDHSLGEWQAYAYVSTDGAADSISIVSLNDLPNTVSKVAHADEDTSLHNIYISNVNYTTGVAINGRQPLLHSMGSNRYGGAHRSYDLINPKAPNAVYTPTEATRDDYTHDGSSFVVTDERVANDCLRLDNGTDPVECDVFVDFNENEMRLWDQTDKTTISELGKGIYFEANQADKHYVHSGWWTEDKKTIYVHDELDEVYLGTHTAMYIFDVSNLRFPIYKGQWTGTTRAIDHNGFVRGNRYYMSNYERGVTILDITDPINPVEIGYFDTFPFSDDDQFNGAWGVYPFLPSGLILASDINSGLYVLQDQTKDVEPGRFSFASNQYITTEGQSIVVNVSRGDDTVGEISVDFQTLTGSASEQDFAGQTGTLTWTAEDRTDKTIEIVINTDTDDLEFTEMFAIELFNPKGGATLTGSGMTWVTIEGNNDISGVKFDADSLTVTEHQDGDTTLISVPVARFPSYEQAITANVSVLTGYAIAATQDSDYTITNSSVSWSENDDEMKSIDIEILNDTLEENDETIILQIESSDDYRILGNNLFTVRLLDDDSNSAPVLTAKNYENTAIEAISLSSLVTVTDDQTDLTYEWALQSTTANATLYNPNSLGATFTAKDLGVYIIDLTVTDPFGSTSDISVVVEKLEAEDEKSKGWLTFNFTAIFFGIGLIIARRCRKLVKLSPNN